MPRMSGFDVLEELKSNKRHKLIPIRMSPAPDAHHHVVDDTDINDGTGLTS